MGGGLRFFWVVLCLAFCVCVRYPDLDELGREAVRKGCSLVVLTLYCRNYKDFRHEMSLTPKPESRNPLIQPKIRILHGTTISEVIEYLFGYLSEE